MKLLMINEVQNLQLELMKKLHTFLCDNHIKYYLIAGSVLGAVRHGGFIPWDDDIDIGMFREDYETFLKICNSFDGEYDIRNLYNEDNCDYGLTRIYFQNTKIDNSSIENTKLDKRLYLDIFPLDNVPDDLTNRAVFERQINRYKKMLDKLYVRNYGNSKISIIGKEIIAFSLKPFRKKIMYGFNTTMQKYRNDTTKYICSLCSQYSFAKQAMPKIFYGEPQLHKFEDTEFYIPEFPEEYLVHLYGANYMIIPSKEKRRKGYNIYKIEG